MNGHQLEDDERGHVRKPSLGFSEAGAEGEEDEDEYQGDYSTRMEELFEDGEGGNAEEDDDEDEEEEEGFLYTGMDADESTGDYRSQLRDVLGPDHEEEEEEEMDELEVETSLLHEVDDEKIGLKHDDSLVSVSRMRFMSQYCGTDYLQNSIMMLKCTQRGRGQHRLTFHPSS